MRTNNRLFYQSLIATFGDGGLPAVTPEGIDAVLSFDGDGNDHIEQRLVPVTERGHIPRSAGAYLFATSYTGPTFYIGSGSGVNGLPTRLGSYFGWANRLVTLDRPRDEDPLTPDSLAGRDWSSMPRAVWRYELTCWALPCGDGQAKVWESRLQQVNRILSGNPMFFGGSAWEVTGELATGASWWAWNRLIAMKAAAEPV